MTELRHTTGDSSRTRESLCFSSGAHEAFGNSDSLFAVASRPDIVSLAGGMPNLSALPMDMMAEVVRNLVATNGTEALQYGSGRGHPLLREQNL
jgi:DNA-binding transcriptional MocR family regulator